MSPRESRTTRRQILAGTAGLAAVAAGASALPNVATAGVEHSPEFLEFKRRFDMWWKYVAEVSGHIPPHDPGHGAAMEKADALYNDCAAPGDEITNRPAETFRDAYEIALVAHARLFDKGGMHSTDWDLLERLVLAVIKVGGAHHG